MTQRFKCPNGHEWETATGAETVLCPKCGNQAELAERTFARDELPPLPRALAPMPALLGTATSVGSRFRIVRLHAQGGLGQVYVALDAELHREVALKEIQDRHADNPASRARFLLEAEITGGLEHPGIVPVYSLGRHGDGRPFYAMRFIRGDSMKAAIKRLHSGEPGTATTGERTLDLRKLLGRFIDVCEAIQYAHDRGVLHRDLKPDNIMLGKYGETLVVDWGLAKAGVGGRESGADEEGAEAALQVGSGGASAETVAGSAVGTLGFMSPEQAAGRLDQLGPPSDVYSLGATLYSILTGKPPLDGTDVNAALARAQTGDFPRPRQIQPDINPALEAICLKAMSLKPKDRYRAPRALADDLEHWLADKPVSAWPEPWAVRTRRWLGTHRTLVTGTAAALCVGLVCLLVATLLLSNANDRLFAESEKVKKANEELADESEQTRKHAQRAEANFAQARQAVARLTQVAREKLGHLPRMEQEQRALLQEARKFFVQLPAEDLRDPSVQSDLGKLYGLLGNVELRFGNLDRAEDFFDKQLAIQKHLAEENPAHEHRREWAHSLSDLADLYQHLHLHKKAEATYRAAIAQREELARAHSERADYQKSRATEYYNVALALWEAGRNEEAEASHRLALPLLEKLADEPSVRADVQDDLSAVHLSLGAVQQRAGRYADAEKSYRQALACKAELARLDPDLAARARGRVELRRIHHRLGEVRHLTGKLTEAEEAYRNGLTVAKKLAEDYPTVPDFYLELGNSYAALASLLVETGQPAAELNKLALEHWRRFPDLLQASSAYPSEQALLWDSWAGRQLAAGDYVEAEKYYRQTLALSQKQHERSPAIPRYRQGLAFTWENVGVALENQGTLDLAQEAYTKAVALHDQLAQDLSYWPEAHAGLAAATRQLSRLLVRRGKTDRAEELTRRTVAVWDRLVNDFPDVPSYREDRGHDLGSLASLLERTGRAQEGEKVYRQQLAVFESLASDFPALPKYQRFVGIVLSNLAVELHRQGRDDEAEKIQRQALAIRARLVKDLPSMPLHHSSLGQNYTNLGILLLETQRPARAEPELQKAREVFEDLHARFPDNAAYASELAAACNSLGNTWRALKQPLKAKASWEQALTLQKKMVADQPDQPDFKFELAMSHGNMGLLLQYDLKQARGAERAYRASLEILTILSEQNPKIVEYQAALGEQHGRLGHLLVADKNLPQARAQLAKSVQCLRQALSINPQQARYAGILRENLQSWIAVLVVAGDDKAAIQAAKELPAWFPNPKEGAFLAGSALSAGMSALDRDTSLTEKERSRRLNELGAEAVALFQKSPPTAAQHVRDMKESPLFQLLRRRDDFKILLEKLER